MKTKTKIMTKLVSLVLSMVMLFYAVPEIVYAESADAISSLFDGASQSESSENTDSPFSSSGAVPIYEVEELREENVKHFRLSDGSYIAAQYTNAVHYLDADGNYVDIDNSLRESSGGIYTNATSRVKFEKKVTGNGALFTLKDGNTKLTFSLNGALRGTAGYVINGEESEGLTELQRMMELEKLSSRIIYADVLDGVDVEYVLESQNVKENIIVKEKKDSYAYSFEIKLNGLCASLTESGDIRIVNSKSGEDAYIIPAPVIFDANGIYADRGIGYYSLSDGGNGKYTLTVTVSEEWMNAEGRAFPVTVDPTIFMGSNIIYDLYVDSDSPNSNYNSSGNLYVDDTSTAYLKFTSLNGVPANAYITNATISLYALSIDADIVKVHRVTSAWDQTLTYNDTVADSPKGALYAYAMSYVECTSDAPQNLTFDITEAAKIWQNNSGLNHGIAIKVPEGSSAVFSSREYTDALNYAEKPFALVSYVNVNGVESYLPYSSHGIGDIVGVVNLATGNLNLTIPTISTTDSLMPYTPTLVYNSSKAGAFNVYPNVEVAYTLSAAALGFRLSMRQSVVKYSYVGDDETDGKYYVWCDSDGTSHYFSGGIESTVFYDEDGLLTELRETRDGKVIITDTDGNVMSFSPTSEGDALSEGAWTLESISDKVGNKVLFVYDGQYPVSIRLVPKNGTEIEMLDVLYGTSGNRGSVAVICSPHSQEAVIFRYSETYNGAVTESSGRYLREVEYVYSDKNIVISADTWLSYQRAPQIFTSTVYTSSKISIEYTSSSLISSITEEISGVSVNYTYSGKKVIAVEERCANENAGQKIGFTYGNGFSELRASGSDDTYGNTDDVVTRYAFDERGRCISSYSYIFSQETIIGAVSGKYEEQENIKNNLKETTTLGGTSTNYIMNGDFSIPDETLQGAKYWEFSGNVSRSSANAEVSFALESGKTESITQYVFARHGEYTLSFLVSSYDGYASTLTVEVASIVNGSPLNEVKQIPLNEHSAVGEIRVSMSFYVGSYVNSGDKFKIKISAETEASQYASLDIGRVMLEDGGSVSDYDLVTMGNFDPNAVNSEGYYTDEPQDVWTASSGTTYRSGSTGYVFNSSAMLYAAYDREVYLKQRIYEFDEEYFTSDNRESNANQSYIVSGYGRSFSAVASENAKFGIKIVVGYYQGDEIPAETVTHEFSFTPGCKDWQFVSGNFSTYIEGDSRYDYVQYIDIYCEYSYQCNSSYAMFDEISVKNVTNNNTVKKYKYYESGMLKSEEDFFHGEYYRYDDDLNLIAKINDTGDLYFYEYNTDGTLATETYYDYRECQISESGIFLPIRSVDSIPEDCDFEFAKRRTVYSYNTYGQPTETKTYTEIDGNGNLVSGSKSITQSYTYDNTQGSFIFGAMLAEEDGLGRCVRYFYDEESGQLLATVNEESGDGTAYTYDEVGRLVGVLPATYVSSTSYNKVNGAENVSYTYNSNNRLSVIETATTEYTFTYDGFGNNTSVKAGESELASYEYNANNGKIKKITYGNGLTEEYTYNELDLVSGICYTLGSNTVAEYLYTYTSDGRIHRFEDVLAGRATVYNYDVNGNVESISEYSTDDMYYDVGLSFYYDSKNRLSSLYRRIADYNNSGYYDISLGTLYTYNEEGALQTEKFNPYQGNQATIDYVYDKYNRVSSTVYNLNGLDYTVSYGFTEVGDKTSAEISEYTVTRGDETSTTLYTYDGNGNITKIVYSTGEEIRYKYDDLGQLLREDNEVLNKTYVYTYDNAGNITSKMTYNLTAEGVTPSSPTSTYNYTYGDSTWGDKLTSYRGQTITYDAIGNPLSYYNGSSYTFTWTGRRLASATKGGNNYTFTYNDEGIRTSKTVNGVTTTYYLNGSQIIGEETNGNITLYLYDSAGQPIGMQYHASTYAQNVWDTYWFEKNLQGDIVAVYNTSGTKLVSYTYDAWGNTTITYSNGGASTTATKNPFRYRGYYYDSDLELHYLQSRYYDSAVGRFINADGYVSTGQGILGNNMYAYCENNPINFVDFTGESIWGVIAVVSTVVLFYELIVSTIISDFSEDDETGDSVYKCAPNDSAGVIYYDCDVGTAFGKTYEISAEAGLYTQSGSGMDGNVSVEFDCLKANLSLGYFGASAGAYWFEATASQEYDLFGKKVRLTVGGNSGVGASLSVGKKTVVGLTLGYGFVFSIEVL